MAVIDLASSKSVWRGLDYYKQNKVKSCDDNGDGTYEGVVSGSEDYHVHLDEREVRKIKECPPGRGQGPSSGIEKKCI